MKSGITPSKGYPVLTRMTKLNIVAHYFSIYSNTQFQVQKSHKIIVNINIQTIKMLHTITSNEASNSNKAGLLHHSIEASYLVAATFALQVLIPINVPDKIKNAK